MQKYWERFEQKWIKPDQTDRNEHKQTEMDRSAQIKIDLNTNRQKRTETKRNTQKRTETDRKEQTLKETDRNKGHFCQTCVSPNKLVPALFPNVVAKKGII